MLYLHGMGHFHPENVISNKFLEDLDIGTSNEWILERFRGSPEADRHKPTQSLSAVFAQVPLPRFHR